MRALPVAAALLVLAAPTFAHAQEQPAAPPETALSDMSEKLADPAFQNQAATMAEIFLGALLDLPVGPFAEALSTASGGEIPPIDPDTRVSDLAPEAEELPERLSDELPRAMNTMSAMAQGMEQMLPALREMADRMRIAMEDGGDFRR